MVNCRFYSGKFRVITVRIIRIFTWLGNVNMQVYEFDIAIYRVFFKHYSDIANPFTFKLLNKRLLKKSPKSKTTFCIKIY